MPVRRVQDEHIGAGLSERLRASDNVAVDTQRRTYAQPTACVHGRRVDGGPQNRRARHAANDLGTRKHRSVVQSCINKLVKERTTVGRVVELRNIKRHLGLFHDVRERGELVNPLETFLRHDSCELVILK